MWVIKSEKLSGHWFGKYLTKGSSYTHCHYSSIKEAMIFHREHEALIFISGYEDGYYQKQFLETEYIHPLNMK